MEIEIADRYVWMQDVTVRIVLYSGTTDYGGLRVYCRFGIEMGGRYTGYMGHLRLLRMLAYIHATSYSRETWDTKDSNGSNVQGSQRLRSKTTQA